MAYPSLLQRLRNNAYRHPRQRTLKPSDRGTWNFTRKGTEGIRALDALEGNLRDLDGRDDMIFPTEFIKVTFLIDIAGYAPFRRVKNVQKSRRRVPQPISRRKVVEYIGEALAEYLQQVRKAEDYDGSFKFGPDGMGLEDLYILELRQYGRTFQPTLGFVPRAESEAQGSATTSLDIEITIPPPLGVATSVQHAPYQMGGQTSGTWINAPAEFNFQPIYSAGASLVPSSSLNPLDVFLRDTYSTAYSNPSNSTFEADARSAEHSHSSRGFVDCWAYW